MKIKNIANAILSFLKRHQVFIASFIIVIFMYMFLYSAVMKDPFGHDPFDQYTRQAEAWTQGKAYLNEDLSYLEIAAYNGKYYVSFPPVPSIVMLPLYLIYGIETPNTYIVTIYAVLAYITSYLFLKRKTSDLHAVFLAFFFVFGSSALVISMSGDVWFQAQLLAFLFTMLAVYCTTSEKRADWNYALMFLALAVGCRPLNIIYFIPIYSMIFIKLRERGMLLNDNKSFRTPKEYIKLILKYIWVPAVIGGAMMVYNYVRFDSPFVFGHKYLPNFTNGYGQFGVEYFINNLMCTFRMPFYEGFSLVFPRWDGFAFWMCCPFFIYVIIEFVMRKKKAVDWIVIACFFVQFLTILFHRGMGGYQFGSRYMIDLMPYAVLILYNGEIKKRTYVYVLAAFGVMINFYGVMYHYLEWMA